METVTIDSLWAMQEALEHVLGCQTSLVARNLLSVSRGILELQRRHDEPIDLERIESIYRTLVPHFGDDRWQGAFLTRLTAVCGRERLIFSNNQEAAA